MNENKKIIKKTGAKFLEGIITGGLGYQLLPLLAISAPLEQLLSIIQIPGKYNLGKTSRILISDWCSLNLKEKHIMKNLGKISTIPLTAYSYPQFSYEISEFYKNIAYESLEIIEFVGNLIKQL